MVTLIFHQKSQILRELQNKKTSMAIFFQHELQKTNKQTNFNSNFFVEKIYVF